jgi:hypothetical protein
MDAEPFARSSALSLALASRAGIFPAGCVIHLGPGIVEQIANPGLPHNVQTPDCLHKIGGAQLFMAPSWTPDQKGVKVQIVEVFALQLATGYEKDQAGRLLLQSDASVSAGRSWSLAKACQLVRNDANPNRWVVLHRHKKAWGLFWAGGGLDQCRDELSKQLGAEVNSTAIVPATPEALLKLVLSMEEPEESSALQPSITKPKRKPKSIAAQTSFPWRTVAITSVAWLVVLTGISSYAVFQLQQQSALIKQLVKEKL